ncbi:MAG: rhodanese-like domain-containing protein [Bacteroidales bacterium]|nr:rhodanese-like domain-containing protein [Bacteroidales bacterium]
MNRNYFFLTALMLLLAIGTMFLSKSEQQKQIEPDKLLWEIIQPTRYVSTDEVAKLIIQNDPSIELIDVRTPKEFAEFSLPNAINIPLDSIVTTSSLEYFGIPGMNVIFFSNDAIQADQGWVMTKRLGFDATYVMKGGLNRWIETIIQPTEPKETAPQTEFDIYQFRKGAQIYFTGAKVETTTNAKKNKVVIKRRKKTVTASGGC